MYNMHANAQRAYVRGAAARYEATGEAHARLSAEAFWRSVQQGFAFLTGGSSWQEAWGRTPASVAESLVHRGSKNNLAHDHQACCL